jgi:general secretion pathway protein A
MYTGFYHFSQKPFDVTPDPSFLYLSESHKEALASLVYGIKERRGFIVLIGEVGTGKTTLIHAALERLGDNIKTAFIFNTDATFAQILQMALIEFGLATGEETISKFTALTRLNQYAVRQFSQGVNIVLIIDEAQNLDVQTMENLRLLSNLETSRHKLVQIVLVGQPELDEQLRLRELRQLAQRINLKRYILPLNESGTYHYIQHHLDLSGYKDRRLFDPESLRLIWRFSKGVPRKINMLCDNVLLLGYALGKKKISGAIVQEAVKDLELNPFDIEIPFSAIDQEEPQTSKQKGRNVGYAWAAGLLFLLILLGARVFSL